LKLANPARKVSTANTAKESVIARPMVKNEVMRAESIKRGRRRCVSPRGQMKRMPGKQPKMAMAGNLETRR
jgi:hypothetical protein